MWGCLSHFHEVSKRLTVVNLYPCLPWLYEHHRAIHQMVYLVLLLLWIYWNSTLVKEWYRFGLNEYYPEILPLIDVCRTTKISRGPFRPVLHYARSDVSRVWYPSVPLQTSCFTLKSHNLSIGTQAQFPLLTHCIAYEFLHKWNSNGSVYPLQFIEHLEIVTFCLLHAIFVRLNIFSPPLTFFITTVYSEWFLDELEIEVSLMSGVLSHYYALARFLCFVKQPLIDASMRIITLNIVLNTTHTTCDQRDFVLLERWHLSRKYTIGFKLILVHVFPTLEPTEIYLSNLSQLFVLKCLQFFLCTERCWKACLYCTFPKRHALHLSFLANFPHWNDESYYLLKSLFNMLI